MNRLELKLIVRGHQVNFHCLSPLPPFIAPLQKMVNGYKFFDENRLLTLYTATSSGGAQVGIVIYHL